MDILFSGVLLAFSIYAYILVGKESPEPTATELGAAFWPRIILVLMAILLVVNIVKHLKTKTTAEGETFNFGEFIKSKLFVGMILVALMAILMPHIGFMPVCFLFLIAYGRLLGEKRVGKSILFSLGITILLYILFQGFLDIMLARGVGVFRNFALFCEEILPF